MKKNKIKNKKLAAITKKKTQKRQHHTQFYYSFLTIILLLCLAQISFSAILNISKIIAYKHYYTEFMAKLSVPEQTKIRRALSLFEVEDKMPSHYIKFIRDGIYEFRVNFGNNEFRLLFIYDGDTIVVLFNCFKKKTQKTPENEIRKAIRLKNEYYEEQQQHLRR